MSFNVDGIIISDKFYPPVSAEISVKLGSNMQPSLVVSEW